MTTTTKEKENNANDGKERQTKKNGERKR